MEYLPNELEIKEGMIVLDDIGRLFKVTSVSGIGCHACRCNILGIILPNSARYTFTTFAVRPAKNFYVCQELNQMDLEVLC